MGYLGGMLLCRVFGHRLRFTASGDTMEWSCARGCGESGSKRYADAESALRYARALDRQDSDDLGRRAPLLGMFPLRLWRLARRRP